MGHLLSYTNGIIGHGLSNDLDEAMREAEERCNEMQQAATIVDRHTYRVRAKVHATISGYTAIKEE